MSPGFSQISCPATSTCPLVGFKMPLKWVMRVDFPDPVEPMIPTKSPSSTAKSTCSSAVVASGIPAL